MPFRTARAASHRKLREPREPFDELSPTRALLPLNVRRRSSRRRRRGEGKTFLFRVFARCLGYRDDVETLFLFEDMTSRDLLQRRSTNHRGESIWVPTSLATAVRLGRLCVLDGIHRLPAGTLSALVRLIQDGEISLYDGTTYVSQRRWRALTERGGQTAAELAARGLPRWF